VNVSGTALKNNVKRAGVKPVALVQVVVGTAALSKVTATATSSMTWSCTVNESGYYVVTHRPGSETDAFGYKNGTIGALEPLSVLWSNSSGTAFALEATCTLIAPSGHLDAIKRIQIGLIQTASMSAAASYTGSGLTRTQVMPTTSGLDWTSWPREPSREDWPWYGLPSLEASRTPTGATTSPVKLNMIDTPAMAWPKYLTPRGNVPITSGTGTMGFTVHLGARTIDRDLGADELYFSEAHLGWSLAFAWPSTCTQDPNQPWSFPSEPVRVPVDVVSCNYLFRSPFRTWLTRMETKHLNVAVPNAATSVGQTTNLQVTVTDTTNNPFAGAKVVAYAYDGATIQIDTRQMSTDQNGHATFSLKGLAAGETTIVIKADRNGFVGHGFVGQATVTVAP
jgi:hypothetical protein